MAVAASIRGRARLTLADFSGGVNFTDNPMLVQPNELPAALNMTLTDAGVVQRFGFKSQGYITGAANAPSYIFFSYELGSEIFVMEGASLVSYAMSPLSSRSVIKTFSAPGQIQCATFNGTLVVVHPNDGVFYGASPGIPSSLTLASSTPKGSAIAVWQNKVWVTGSSVSGQTNRVWWSNAGNATVWTTATDYVDVREPDDDATIAFGNGNGMDVVGRGGLLVAKRSSLHRIYDSTTGAYTTVDTTRGAGGREAFTSGPDGTYMANVRSIYRIRGDSVEEITDRRVSKIWSDTANGVALGTPVAWSANGRHFFGASGADRILEWVPGRDCWFVHQVTSNSGVPQNVWSAASFSWLAGLVDGAFLLAGTSGQAFNVLEMPAPPDGTDASVYSPVVRDQWDPSTGIVTFSWQPQLALPWIGNGLDDVRLARVLLNGWCGDGSADVNVAVTVYRDFDQSTLWRTLSNVTFPAASGVAAPAMTDRAVINEVGTARAFQLRLVPASTSATGRTPDAPFSLASTIMTPNFGIVGVQADLVALRA